MESLDRQYFAKEGLEVDAEFKYTVQNPSLHRARVIAERMSWTYTVNGELDEVYHDLHENGKFIFHGTRRMHETASAGKRGFHAHPAPADIYQEEIKVEIDPWKKS